MVGRRRPPPRRVARLLHALCDRAHTARRYRHCGDGLRRRGGPRGNCRTARSPHWTRGCARRTKSSRRSQPTTDWHSRHCNWQHHLRRRCHWSIPRTSGGAEHDMAREAQPGYQPQGIPDRPSALVRVGGGDRLSIDGLPRGDGGTCRPERLARPVRPQRTAALEWRQHVRVAPCDTGLFALLFRFLPDVRLRWRDVMTGALTTAVLFTIGQQLIGLYLGQSSMASSYGAAGSVMILLLWVYYSCQILLLGAEFTRVYAQRYGTKPGPESFAEKDLERPQLGVDEGTLLPHHVVDQSCCRAFEVRAANTARCAGHITLYRCEDLESMCLDSTRFSGADPTGQVLRCRWIAQCR